jgi:lysophospholipase
MALPLQFEEPANFKWGSFTDAGGARIRYGTLLPEGEPKGTIIHTPGFREPLEKYFEYARDMTARGFAVHIMDWHGQGGSDRFLKDNPQKMYSNGYEEHVETLHQFATTIVPKTAGPLILSAHSMGAHIGLRYLKEHDGVFDSAIFTSPMCDILTPGYPRKVAEAMVRAARIGKFLGKYVPKSGDWNEAEETDFKTNKLTSDPVRHAVTAEIYKQKPELKAGAATFGWVMHTLKSANILNDENYLKSIKTPILMGISGDEQIVDRAASERAAGLLQNCTRVDFPKAKHELWMESDIFRAPWLKRVGDFLTDRLVKNAPQPKKNTNRPRPPRFG